MQKIHLRIYFLAEDTANARQDAFLYLSIALG